MNRFSKLALGVVAALAVSPAFATIDPYNLDPNTFTHTDTNVLVLVNDYHGTTLFSTYAYEMNQGVAALLGTKVTNASLSTVNSISSSQSISNASLTSFLSDTAGSFTFSVQGFDSLNGDTVSAANVGTVGQAVGMFTTVNGSAVTNLTGSNFTGNFSKAGNSFLTGSGGVADAVTGPGTFSTAYAAAGDVQSTQGLGGNATGVSDWVGSGIATNLYGVTGNGTAASKVQSYILGTAKLDLTTKSIVFAGNSTGAVPVPGAVWLLGSGLLGLVGVSRRRAV